MLHAHEQSQMLSNRQQMQLKLQQRQQQATAHKCRMPRQQQQQQQHQQQRRATTAPAQLLQQWAVLLIAFILLQHADVLMCRRIPAASAAASKRATHAQERYVQTVGAAATAAAAAATGQNVGGSSSSSSNSGSSSNRGNGRGGSRGGVVNRPLTASKRSIGGGQPEEIFSVDDRMDTNYDEYPMVVPKRAALLLDRLMVALHHALEDERRKLSDFYAEHNDKPNAKDDNAPKSVEDELEQTNANHMYSDDDPSVIMDYDFKDLNSINRATGETLMGKSFQRRGNMGMDLDLGGGDGVAMLRASTAAALDEDASALSGIDGVGDGVGGVRNGGRMYWRCYFNAVSCF